jgi:alpha-tubulin suppressor-like RCC1 family protein
MKVGQLGVGPSEDTSVPEKIEKYTDEHIILNSGWGHTIGYSNKRVISWGSNKHGQWLCFQSNFHLILAAELARNPI